MEDSKDEIDLILQNVADVIIENKTKPPSLTDDPFDFYVQRVQSSLFSKKETFQKRFVQGYHVLVNQLKN